MKSMNFVKTFFASFILIFSLASEAQNLFEECNHVIDMSPGQKININSPYYPSKIPIGTSCRYIFRAPTDYQLNFKCNIQLDATKTNDEKCPYEIFYFNREGSEFLTESEYFCGAGKMERKSFLNRATVFYISKNVTNKTNATPFIFITDKKQNINANSNSNINSNTVTNSYNSYNSNNYKNNNKQQKIPLPTTIKKPISVVGAQNAPLTHFITVLSNHNFNTNNAEYNSQNRNNFKTTTSATTHYLQPLNILSTVTWLNDTWNTTSPILTLVKSMEKRGKIVIGHNPTNGAVDYRFGYGVDNAATAAAADIENDINRFGGKFSCLVEVIQSHCDCGWIMSTKVAGDKTVAEINEFPSMAGVLNKQTNRIFCGAAIIHERYLISAAHCFNTPNTKRPDRIRVVVGEHDVSTVFETLYTRNYEIEKILPHEQFRSTATGVRHDIALLRTHLPITWNRGVGPACLPFKKLHGRKIPVAHQRLITAGWGTTSFGGAQSTRLLKTTLDVISNDECKRRIPLLPISTFCTFTQGADTCQYDSGGALYLRERRMFAVGIVSFGYACATEEPSVNVRLASYLMWIQNSTPDASYCVI